MKDFDGNELKIGDTVAIIYHPEAYEFCVEPAVLIEVKGKTNMVSTQLLKKDIKADFKPDASGEVYPKLVKVDPVFDKVKKGIPVDAIGHIIAIGSRIACRKTAEAGGNTVKGFEKGGKVVKITEHYVFYSDETSGETKRKGFNGVVVY